MKLLDKVALVTGAGAGIGGEIALLFAEEGAIVVVNDVNLAAARKTTEAIESANGRAWAIQADVSDSRQVKQMFAELEARFRGLDILVNNAGIAAPAQNGKRLTGRQKHGLTS